MNPAPFSSSSRPRLNCRVVRLVHALSENTGGAHVAACADCQAFYRATQQLDTTLRRGAPAMREAVAAEASPAFERDLLRAIREARAAEEPVPARRSSWTWALGGVATAGAAAAIAFAFLAPKPASSGAASAEVAAVVDAVGDLSARLTETVIPTTGALVANNPLQREIGSVYTDARSALNFLALNFLPVSETIAATDARPASAI